MLKRIWCRSLWLPLLGSLFCLLICIKVYAKDARLYIPDLDEIGSISVQMRANDTGEPISGGTMTLYMIGRSVWWNNMYQFRVDPDFTEDIYSHYIDYDMLNDKLAQDLLEYAYKNDIEGETQVIDDNGKVKFKNLEAGLYLLAQKEAPEGYYCVNPFFVTLPIMNVMIGIYEYDVDASPKTQKLEPIITPAPLEPAYYNPAELEPAYYNPAELTPAYYNPAELVPAYHNPAELTPAYHNPAELTPAYHNPAELEPAYHNPAELTPAYHNPAELTPAYHNPAELEPAYHNPAELTPAYHNLAELTPAYYNPAELTPAYHNPAELTPAYYNPAELTPTYHNPVELTSAYYNPAELTSAYYNPAELEPAYTKLAELEPAKASPSDAIPEEIEAELPTKAISHHSSGCGESNSVNNSQMIDDTSIEDDHLEITPLPKTGERQNIIFGGILFILSGTLLLAIIWLNHKNKGIYP